jgi:hypothetical protein
VGTDCNVDENDENDDNDDNDADGNAGNAGNAGNDVAKVADEDKVVEGNNLSDDNDGNVEEYVTEG